MQEHVTVMASTSMDGGGYDPNALLLQLPDEDLRRLQATAAAQHQQQQEQSDDDDEEEGAEPLSRRDILLKVGRSWTCVGGC